MFQASVRMDDDRTPRLAATYHALYFFADQAIFRAGRRSERSHAQDCQRESAR